MTIYSIYRNLNEQHEVITAEKIKKLYTQIGMYPQTLLDLFRKHNEDALKLVGRGRAMATCKKYDLAYRRAKEFLTHQYEKDDIYLDNLN